MGASDGTTVTTRDVTVVVTNDRQSAAAAVIAPFNPNTSYVSSTLDNYNAVYADVMNQLSSASDEVFNQILSDLNSAVLSLQLLTPLLNDGSVNYRDMFVSSTFGNAVPNLLDNTNDSFVCYCQAQNLTHTMDFGPSFKISANAFELQVRASFPERIGGVAIFGSNDKEIWTRLTPGLTTVTEDMQTLDVDDSLQNEQYRFLKIQMIQPSSSMLELGEFRILGERHDMVTQIAGTIEGALEEAEKLPAEDYTKQSYYLFQKELEYVKSAVGNSGFYRARARLTKFMTPVICWCRTRVRSIRSKETPIYMFGFSSSTDGTVIWNRSLRSGKGRASDQPKRYGYYIVLPADASLCRLTTRSPLQPGCIGMGAASGSGSSTLAAVPINTCYFTPRSGTNTLRF